MRRGTIRSLIQHWFEWIQLRRTTIGTSYNRLSTAQTKWPTDEWVRAINYPVGLHLQRNSRDTEVRTPSCPKAICTCESLVTNCAPFQRSGQRRRPRSLSRWAVCLMFKLPDTSNPAEINGLMTVDAWTCGRSGVYVQNAIHTSTGLSGKMIVQGSKLVSVQLDAPEEATNTLNFDSRLFLIQEDGPKAVQQKLQFSNKSCSPTRLSRTFGAELCAELDFYPRTKTRPGGPLAGPARAAIFLRKMDKHSSYERRHARLHGQFQH